MGAFRGGASTADPLVGEIVGLRTFRVDESGLLLPLYGENAWYDGPNTATCQPPTGDRNRAAHAVPADECECGFYAYGTPAAAARHRQARYVRAVVSCWGSVVAGTQGVRAQHARIDAIWLHRSAPVWLRRRVAQRYPSARLFADADAMLAEHPTSVLPCYEPPPRRHAVAATLAGLSATAVLALGLLPFPLLRATGLWTLWAAALAGAAVLTLWLGLGARSAGHLAAAFVMTGVVAWLAAPLCALAAGSGWPAWLLRVPLARGLLVAGGGYLLALRPHHFPMVKVARPKAFCGVAP